MKPHYSTQTLSQLQSACLVVRCKLGQRECKNVQQMQRSQWDRKKYSGAKSEPVSKENRCKLAFVSVWWAFFDRGIKTNFTFHGRDFPQDYSIPQQITLSVSQ